VLSKEAEMKISVITATWNSASTVRDTLQSVATQEYPDIEHIIMDGRSTDATLDIVGQFPHVAKLVSEKDKGIYDAMNKGIAHATGEIIGILNSDDFYMNGSVLSHVARVFEHSGCGAVYGDLLYVDPADTNKIIRYWRSGAYRKGAFKWGWMPPHPTFFVRRDVYEQYGTFNLNLGTAADYELMLRFVHKYGVHMVYLPEVLVRMRNGGASSASVGARWRANRRDREAWRVNGLKPFWFTVYLKPLRKLRQYVTRYHHNTDNA
jgi:glycosyltransferase involved in cell wall biosynthesis